MGRLIKWLFYLLIMAMIALVLYAYAGPVFDPDFAPDAEEVRIPVELDAN